MLMLMITIPTIYMYLFHLTGASNLDDCPIERYIPIWLIVMGVFQMIETIFRTCFHGSRNDEDESQGSVDPVACFLCAWFIAGNVWVFRNWNESVTLSIK